MRASRSSTESDDEIGLQGVLQLLKRLLHLNHSRAPYANTSHRLRAGAPMMELRSSAPDARHRHVPGIRSPR